MKKLLSVMLVVFLLASCALPAAALEEYAEAETADAAPEEAEASLEAEDAAGSAMAEESPAEESVPASEPEAVSETEAGPVLPAPDEDASAAMDGVPEYGVIDAVTVIQTSSGEEGGLDNDDLFALYVEDQMYPNHAPFTVWSDGAGLTGLDAVLYERLSAEIKRVAAGERASTAFSYSLEELGLQVSWTWAELGLSSNKDLSGASDALGDAYSYNFNAILDALLSNFPYELYWYDKTRGSTSGLSYSLSYNGSALTVDGTITVSMPVSRDYELADLTVDTAVGASVQTTVSAAKAIVAKYAGRSDWEKLDAYRQEICDLTSYNDDAARDTARAYGNPWQLIWVFDGDPTTTVVCEGYAKAFKYLFDLSSFSADLSCIMVTGDMRTSGSPEAHMWNVVRMDDGRNYLVDITNCDTGSVGDPDQLFLAGYSSGSLSGGYTYQCGSGTVYYAYDSTTFSIFENSQLTVSGERYTAPAPLAGDVNGDKKVNVADLIRLLRYVNGQDGVAVPMETADMNADGEINLADLLRLMKLVVAG